MKAVIYNRYGPANVLELTEVDKPEPNNHEVLIRIHATTVSSADWRARSLELPPGFGLFGRLAFGLFKPRKPVLGTELSGVIEAIGKGVTKFNTGDEVFAFPGEKLGCYA